MTTEKKIDFTVKNSRLNTNTEFNLPFGWSCNWHKFYGRSFLYPCVSGRIQSNIILEGLYDVRGEVFFVMFKIGTFFTVMRISEDPTQYYFFNVDTEILVKLTEHYPTLEAFMAKASLWEGGNAQINSVTPFEVLDYAPEARDLDELTIEWRAALRALA
ncbi:hypothetical protein ARMSODRAFT_1009246 [Armillaria solidipes]|uniref:Uncharacterized protein n=1 Tax=Armillaria solidipes TaxID=1076256 RepID=A0A2H3B3G2_9AGAR|nr:hypothetical protein ARMSODRAFT_1009246 [Armillaria solidipes]